MSISSAVTMQIFGLICGGFFVAIFAGVGIYLLIRFNKDKQKAASSQTWPSTSGRIVEARVTESTSTDSDGDRSTYYSPQIVYEYEVMGSPIRGDKIYVGLKSSSSNYKKAQEKVAQYPIGKTVSVFYNPDDPTDAVLERRAQTTTTLVLGIIFLVIGVCLGLPIVIVVLTSLRSGGV